MSPKQGQPRGRAPRATAPRDEADRGPTATVGGAAAPPYAAAAVVGLALFALYVMTLAPTTAFWDTSEYIATAHILGIPHPPGNPLFVVLGRVWSVLLAPTGLDVAVRVNLLAATTSAAAGGFFYLIAHRILSDQLGRGRAALVGSGAAALLGGTAFTVWNQSNVNEKVYTLSVLIIAAVMWLALRWRDRRDEPGSERLLLTAVYLVALGSTNHLMSVLPVPAVAVLVLGTRPALLLRRRFLVRALAAVVVGLSFNFFLPIRAAQGPVINEGEPTCPSLASAAVAIYSNGAAGCPALADNLTRRQYQKPPFLKERMAPLTHQLLNFYQYLDWQWARGVDASEQPGGPRTPLTLAFIVLALAGLWAAYRADRWSAISLGVLVLTLTFGLVYYLNFKYGYSLAPEITGPGTHEVRERDYFFVAGFMVVGVLAGIGLAWCWGAAATLVRHRRRRWITAPVLGVVLLPLVFNAPWASRRGDWAARDWAYDLLMSVEPYGVLFTNGDNDTFPLWYLQEVEGIRQDVTVIVGQYLFTPWYPKQLRDLTAPGRQRPFVPEQAEGLYPPPPAAPRSAILSLDDARLDRMATTELPENLTLDLPGLAVTYPAGTVLTREHQIALTVIYEAGRERPIYFASGGGLMGRLGLDPWGVRQGLATKLVLRPRGADPPEGAVRSSDAFAGEWVDLPRSLALYRDVYLYRGLRDRALWPDRSTLNVPYYYYALALQLADLARQEGLDPSLIEGFENDAAAFRLLSRGGVAVIGAGGNGAG